MKYQNLFEGYSKKAKFARTTYRLLMTRNPITYANIMACAEIKNAKKIPDSVANSDYYGELKKALPEVCRAIKEMEGENSIVIEGNNRNRSFQYVGKDDDPLKDMINAKTINDLNKYWRFCQDSAGFFPASWLVYFFGGYQDLFQMKAKKRKGDQVIIADQNRQLTNIELLPSLYNNIINHQVLFIKYKPFDKDTIELEFHPHLLKEYNGRWFLFGHADGIYPEFGYNLPIDRIVETPIVIKDKTIIPPPSGFYSNYFNGIVGVTRNIRHMEYDISIRAYSLYFFKLTETKKLHPSQKTTKPFDKYEDGEYGEFVVHLEVNNEFIGRILQMGAGLEIVGPSEVRKILKKRVCDLYHLYESD